MRCVPDGPEGEAYRVYTREFDLTPGASEVLKLLQSASPDAERGWLVGENLVRREAVLRTETLFADQRASLAAQRSEIIDSIHRSAGPLRPDDIIVALLIDQSGSMKGEPISFAAAMSSLLADLLAEAGIRSEVYGFSTAGWHGGHAYRHWKAAGRPARPGRLCALMHVVYKSAEEPSLGEDARAIMVHPDLLRENVDGEAIEWAQRRLLERPEPNKLLIVISDGAPVDDATLKWNGPSYLYRHLTSVLRNISIENRLTIGGIGINHRVESFYPLSKTVSSPDDLLAAAVRLLPEMIAAHRQRGTGADI